MRRYIGIVIPLIVTAIVMGLLIWLISIDPDSERLQEARDIAIILVAFVMLVATVLLSILVGAFVWLAFLIKDKISPTLDTVNAITLQAKDTVNVVSQQTTDTVGRVKGTTDFVTENVAAPLISVAGLAAQGRAWTRVATGRDRKRGGSPVTRLLRRGTPDQKGATDGQPSTPA
jgi:hypothetical protein